MMRYWRRVRTEKHPVRFLLSRLFWKTGLSTWFLIRKEDYLLRFYPSALSATLWLDPRDRLADEVFLRSYLRPGDVMLDVGANIGHLSVLSSRVVGDTGKVVAVEAHPKTFKYLQGNVALNGAKNVNAYNVALGNEDGSIFFSDVKSDDQNAIVLNSSGIRVPLRRLDDIPIIDPCVNLMKIDVEGYEKFVLEGAAATLNKTRCIYFESWASHFARYSYVCRDLYELLLGKGFQIYKLEGQRLSPISADYVSEQCENLVAIRDFEEFWLRTGAQIQHG